MVCPVGSELERWLMRLSCSQTDWVKLERKGRYAGEIYLELTWYSSVSCSCFYTATHIS